LVYEPRTYRNLHSGKDLFHFRVVVGETDLDIAVRNGQYREDIADQVKDYVIQTQRLLIKYIESDPDFLTALQPHRPLPGAPCAVIEMCEKTKLAGVGPMAAVAGLFSESVGKLLARYSRDVIVENGGDIWLKSSRVRRVGIYAGSSPFSYRIGMEILPSRTPLGICTSSGTIGHSLSFGCADAVVIVSPSAVLADAAATAACNMVQTCGDLEKAVSFALNIPGVAGAAAIMGDKMAVRGEVKLVPLD